MNCKDVKGVIVDDWCTIPTFALRDRGHWQIISVRVTDVPAEIQIENHQNSIHKCYLLNQSALSLVSMSYALQISTFRLLLFSLFINLNFLLYLSLLFCNFHSIFHLLFNRPSFPASYNIVCTFPSRDLPLSIFMFPGSFFHWAHFSSKYFIFILYSSL